MTEDDGFKLPTPEAQDALESASCLLEWYGAGPANRTIVSSFCDKLVQHLQRCFPEGSTGTAADRGEMWRNFIAFRISRDHFLLWNNFLMSSVKRGGPILFQHITNYIWKELIKQQHPISAPPPPHHASVNEVKLTHDEMSIVRYTTGYIPRNLIPVVDRSARPNKRSLRMCLLDMIEQDGLGDEESNDWVRELNRGGLNEVTNNMFRAVCAMELCVKKYLEQQDMTKPTAAFQDQLLKLLGDNKEVERHWNEVSSEWDPEESALLFKMVTELWVTTRGNSYVSAWIEKWKQANKTTTQKAKGLRQKRNKS